jgi:hypothetical protein
VNEQLSGKLPRHTTYLLGMLQFSGGITLQLAISEKLKEIRNGDCWKCGENCGLIE